MGSELATRVLSGITDGSADGSAGLRSISTPPCDPWQQQLTFFNGSSVLTFDA